MTHSFRFNHSFNIMVLCVRTLQRCYRSCSVWHQVGADNESPCNLQEDSDHCWHIVSWENTLMFLIFICMTGYNPHKLDACKSPPFDVTEKMTVTHSVDAYLFCFFCVHTCQLQKRLSLKLIRLKKEKKRLSSLFIKNLVSVGVIIHVIKKNKRSQKTKLVWNRKSK